MFAARAYQGKSGAGQNVKSLVEILQRSGMIFERRFQASQIDPGVSRIGIQLYSSLQVLTCFFVTGTFQVDVPDREMRLAIIGSSPNAFVEIDQRLLGIASPIKCSTQAEMIS